MVVEWDLILVCANILIQKSRVLKVFVIVHVPLTPINGTHILTIFQPLNAGTHIWGVVLVHPYHSIVSKQMNFT